VNALGGGAPTASAPQYVQDPFAGPVLQQYGMGLDNNQFQTNTQFQPSYPNPNMNVNSNPGGKWNVSIIDFISFISTKNNNLMFSSTDFSQYGGYGAPNMQQQQMPQQPKQNFAPNPNSQMPQFPQQFAMFQQPIVQDMAMEYGQKLADQGKQIVNSQFEKYIPVTKLKYYFAVDNRYVINKMRLIFFPFTHKVSNFKY
jgi:hypothetical protein